MKLYRIIDANINRVAEGLRVLEDLARFHYDNEFISNELRILRHKTRKGFSSGELLEARDSVNDVGRENSRKNRLDKKESLEDLVLANFKRVEEGLRVLEESLKLQGHYQEAKAYESLRFQAYNLEKTYPREKFRLATDIYGILGQEFSQPRNNIEVSQELIQAGVRIIQYRDKTRSPSECYQECLEIRRMTREAGVFFIVNDSLELALAVGADGLHIGQEDGQLDLMRRASQGLVLGVSTHNRDQVLEAIRAGADYIGVGPIFPTSTKKDVEDSQGLDFLNWVRDLDAIDYVAIGGIKEDNIARVEAQGGHCFAMISELVAADDIGLKVENIRKKLGGRK